MRATARIVAEADGRGGTRLAVLRGESPLLLRQTGPRTDAARGLTVHLVGGAAGPLLGDDLRLDIEVGPGAALEIRSVAASMALPGRAGRPPSRLEIHAAVAAGATLRWLPEPLIAVAGCHHLVVSDVRIDTGGALVWRDDLVCGRHGEPAGDVRSDIVVRSAGRTIYRHELAVGPGSPGWSGAAVLGAGATVPNPGTTVPGSDAVTGNGRAVGSVILVGGNLPAPAVLGEDAVLMPLAAPAAMLATAIGPDIRRVRAALDPLCDPAPAPPHPATPAGPLMTSIAQTTSGG